MHAPRRDTRCEYSEYPMKRPRRYKAADVVCMPSRNEPFGLVVLEAW